MPDAMRIGRWLRRLLWVLLALCLLLVLAVILIETPPGKAGVASLISKLVTTHTAYRLDIRGLSGLIPGHVRIESIEVDDPRGDFVAIENLELRLSLWRLLRGQVHLHQLEVGSLTLWQRPIPKQKWRVPRIPSLPVWPRIDALHVNQLVLKEAVLGTEAILSIDGTVFPVEGASFPEASFEIAGQDTEATRATLSFNYKDGLPQLLLQGYDEALLPELLDAPPPFLIEVDGRGGRDDWNGNLLISAGGAPLVEGNARLMEEERTSLQADLTVHASRTPVIQNYAAVLGNKIQTSVSASIDRQGLLDVSSCTVNATLLDFTLEGRVYLEEKRNDLNLHLVYRDITALPGVRQDTGPMAGQVTATLAGPFTKPVVALQATLNDTPILEADMHGDLGTIPALTGTITVYPGRLPLEALPYSGDEALHTDMNVAYDEEAGELRVHKLLLSAAGAKLDVKGHAIPHLPSLDLTARLEAEDLSTVGALLGTPLRGAMYLDLTAGDDANGLSFSLALNGTELEAAPLQLQETTLTVEGRCKTWTAFPPSGLHANLNASTRGLMISEQSPGDWTLEAQVATDDAETLQLSSLSLTDGNVQITGGCDFAVAERQFTLTLDTAAAALDRLPFSPEQMPGGSLQAALTAQGTLQPLSITATVDGTLDALTRLPAAAAALAGTTLRTTLKGSLDNNSITLSSLDLSGAAFNASASASYDLETGAVVSKIQGSLPELRPLGAALDQQVSGAVSLDADLSGSLEALSARAGILGKDIIVNDFPPAQLNTTLDSANLTGPRKEIQVEARLETGAEPLYATATTVVESGHLFINPLVLRAGDNRITGSASYALDRGAPEATMELFLQDLAALGRLADIPLSGTAEGTISFQEGALTGDLEARALSYNETRVKTASAKIRMQQQDNDFFGSAGLKAAGIIAGSIQADSVTVDLEGGLNEARVTAQTRGHVATGTPETQSFSLQAKSLVFAKEQRAVLEALKGLLGDFEYGLEEPARLSTGESGITVDPMTLRFGTGRIHLEGQQRSDGLSGTLRLDSFPLAAGVLFTTPPFTGTLDGEMLLAGTLAAPKLDATFSINEGRMQSEGGEGLAPLFAKITTNVEPGSFNATVTADMEDILHLEGRVQLPIQVQVQPWLLEAPLDTGLSGETSFELQFQPLLNAFGLVQHYLDGHMKGAFTLGGGLTLPDLRGEAVMEEARYENAQTGTRLEDLNVTVTAEGDTIRLRECTADTDKQGSMTATGEMRLLYTDGFPFSGTVTFKDAQFANLEYMNGRMNGDITAEGTLADMLVKGDLKITPVYASMPDELPVKEPTTLEVTEIRDGEVINEEAMDAPGSTSRIRLDITCDIPGKAYARAPILDSEWGGKLHVGGTLADMVIDGRIKVLRGHLDFLNRRFVLRDSALLFLDGSPEKPYLDMQAVVETPELTARLTLKGELEDVKMELTSEPQLPQDEILAHILFGRNLSRLSPVQAIQLARVAAMFNQGLSGIPLFSGNVKLPGIDRFDLRTGERADETAVGMGKYFTDSVYVEVEQGTTTDSSKVSVEVEVTPQLSVKGDADAKERSGVGLFWKKDY